MEKATITVKEVAQALGICLPKAYEIVASDNFPSFRLGRRIVIPAKDFENWLSKEAGKKEAIT